MWKIYRRERFNASDAALTQMTLNPSWCQIVWVSRDDEKFVFFIWNVGHLCIVVFNSGKIASVSMCACLLSIEKFFTRKCIKNYDFFMFFTLTHTHRPHQHQHHQRKWSPILIANNLPIRMCWKTRTNIHYSFILFHFDGGGGDVVFAIFLLFKTLSFSRCVCVWVDWSCVYTSYIHIPFSILPTRTHTHNLQLIFIFRYKFRMLFCYWWSSSVLIVLPF